ncbi:MAG: RapZ C-terminal domain-containing protein, partial [Saprospiraceae bacterium]
NINLPVEIPYLKNILHQLCNSPLAEKINDDKIKSSPLTVIISSFSYKEGLPQEDYPNGGGFVFDCRSIHNPGRYEPYKTQTGRDQSVKDFLLAESHIEDFLHHVFGIVDKAVEISIERNYEKLSVHFGCTGGQHRSVYSADAMTKHLQEKYGIQTKLTHTVQERKNWVNERY